MTIRVRWGARILFGQAILVQLLDQVYTTNPGLPGFGWAPWGGQSVIWASILAQGCALVCPRRATLAGLLVVSLVIGFRIGRFVQGGLNRPADLAVWVLLLVVVVDWWIYSLQIRWIQRSSQP